MPFTSDPNKTKVVAAKGGVRSLRMTNGLERENTTVLICMSSESGEKRPSLCVFRE